MVNYYFEVMKDNVSICLDSDIGYHHHFKIGDVLLIIMDDDLGITLTGGNTTSVFALNHTVASRSTDVRNLLFEPGTAGRGNIKVECTKYIGKNGTINLDNIPVLRISEALLNRAEARATAGSPVLDLAGALTDLKSIKGTQTTQALLRKL